MTDRLLGMYVHQHWAFNHPYAARTWTFADWQGYIDGLHRLGYNALLIWPVLETMPAPLTESDRKSLDKIARAIDMAHAEFGMRVYLALCPNVVARNEEAAKYTFEERPFFYCDRRIDPGDTQALTAMIEWRAQLLAPLAQLDGAMIIDSDPGGYPGSTHAEFVDLLMAHRRMLDRLRPGIELIYWVHVGWQAYCDFYRTGEFRWGTSAELEETIDLLARQAPEPWGLANGLEPAQRLGLADRVFAFQYGAVEGEPSYPLTNYGSEGVLAAAQSQAPRGVMANAQTHCLQLPNTFAFAQLARRLPLGEAEYKQFGDELLPGQGTALWCAWKTLAGQEAEAMEESAAQLEARVGDRLEPGPLAGLLFGDPRRLVVDLALQLRFKAAFVRLGRALECQRDVVEALGAAVTAVETWQGRHGYKNAWNRPELEGVLRRLGDEAVEAALDCARYQGEGDTPFARLQDGFAKVETFGPRLLAALRQAYLRRRAAGNS